MTVFDNEPMARMAEQRLRQVGISCVTRSLRGGPGLWGSAYNLPHDLLVSESDETSARELLGLPPPDLAEREARGSPQRTSHNVWVVLAGAVLVGLFLLILVSLLNGSGG